MNHCVIEVSANPPKIWANSEGERVFEALSDAEEFEVYMSKRYTDREFVVHTLIPR